MSDSESEFVPNNKKAKTVNDVEHVVREVPNRCNVIEIENLSHRGHSLEKEAKDEAIYVEVGLQGEAVNVKNEPQDEFITVKEEIEEEVDEIEEEVARKVGPEVVVKVRNDVCTVLHDGYSQRYVISYKGLFLCS